MAQADGEATSWTAKEVPLPRSQGRRILALLGRHKTTLAGLLAVSLVLNLFGLVAPRFTQAILDRVLPTADFTLLTRLVLILTLVTAFQILFTVWRRLTLVRFSLKLDRLVLSEFCAHVLALPAGFFKQHRAGDLVARWGDHGHVRHLFAGSLTRVAIDALMVIIYFAVLFTYSIRLALVVVGLLLAFAGFTFWQSTLLKRQHRRHLDAKSAHEAHLIEVVTGIDLVKALAIERPIQRQWEELFRQYLGSNYRTQRLRQLLESGGAAIQFLATVALLWYGAVLVLDGILTTGELVAFSMYATQAIVPLVSLITLWDEVQQARVALERIEEVLRHEPEGRNSAEPRVSLERLKGHVRFEQVCFRYPGPDTLEVLRGISFEVQPGERLAVVGPSGSGKTTLARLLLGLYRPTRGQILIDGCDLERLDLTAYRQQVGVVLQDNLLLSGTIQENIAVGDPRPDEGRVQEVAELVGAHAFIAQLPRGYATLVGELGLTLSGGQRQRLSLARALYRNPRLLVLDEAFSALDAPSAESIRQRLPTILADRTTLIIAHNLATFREAGQILVLQDGRIVEQGTHEALLARRGTYLALAADSFEA